MDYICQAVESIIALPVDDYVIGVHIASQSHVIPRVEDGPVAPPKIRCCFDRHIIRTEQSVVVADVRAKIVTYPKIIEFSDVRETARKLLVASVKAPSPEAFERGLAAMSKRLVHKMRLCGVEITND